MGREMGRGKNCEGKGFCSPDNFLEKTPQFSVTNNRTCNMTAF